MPEDAHAAGIGPDAADDAANQRGFTGAVGAEQTKTGALMNFERYAIDGDHFTETLDDGVDL